MGAENVISLPNGRTGMGGAVRDGLNARSPWDGQSGRAATEWVWLLHDDAAPAPEALAELLGAVERAPSVTVAGCKQLDWHSGRRLIDVGLSTSRWAERLTMIDADELDQGQYNGRTDTFAVNSAGMLVRRDIWEQLKGFDPALPGTGDDVDFCWRNRLAGHRVVVVPTARMFHVAHRPHAQGNPSAARKAQVHLRLKHAPLWKVPIHAVGALLGSIFKLVLSIAVKDPGHGFSQLAATFAALARPAAVAKSRRTAASTRRIRRSVIKKLQTPRRDVWNHRRSLMEALGADKSTADGLLHDPLADQPTGDSSDDFAALTTTERGWVGAGALAAVIIAAAASLTALSGLFRAEAVSGGGLIPVSASLGEIWHHASSWWISLGAGLPGKGDPFGYVLWVLGLFGGGDANAAMSWLLLLGCSLVRTHGVVCSRRRDHPAPVPLCCGPVLGGRSGPAGCPQPRPRRGIGCPHHDSPRGPGTLARHGLRRWPWAVYRPLPGRASVHRKAARAARHQRHAVLDGGCRRGTGPGCCVPQLRPRCWPPLCVLIVLCGLMLGRRGRTVWWALLPSAALFLPFGLSVIDRPRALLADPGVAAGIRGRPAMAATPRAAPAVRARGWPVRAFHSSADRSFRGRLCLRCWWLSRCWRLLWRHCSFPANEAGRRGHCGWRRWSSWWVAGWPDMSPREPLPTPWSRRSPARLSRLPGSPSWRQRLSAPSACWMPQTVPPHRSVRRTVVLRSATAIGMVVLLAGPLAGMAVWSAQNVLRPAAAAQPAGRFGRAGARHAPARGGRQCPDPSRHGNRPRHRA